MTFDLDSAIQHCEEVAEEQERYYNQDGTESFCVKHSDCASEHRQLAEWLKELKRYKELFESPEEAERCLNGYMV